MYKCHLISYQPRHSRHVGPTSDKVLYDSNLLIFVIILFIFGPTENNGDTRPLVFVIVIIL